MKTITVKASRKYDILIGKDLLKSSGELISNVTGKCTAAIVTDDIVDALYGNDVLTSLEKAGFSVCKFVFPHGEASKNLNLFGDILEFLAEKRLTKSDIIIALGGGVTGDMAGFAASVYLREIRFVQIPTTLLAAVDSSVGGKTAVNLKAGKNLAGSFCQPSLVICDTECFKTLPNEIFADGVSEALKYGLISDIELFEKISKGIDMNCIDGIVESCVKIKRDLVVKDEFDNGERQLLNFGHTIGHAIEKLSSYTISHGHAVAIGMAVVSNAAYRIGLSEENCFPAVLKALKANNLPSQCEFSAEGLAQAALSDKKRRGDSITLVIPQKLGCCRLHPIEIGKLRDFIAKGLDGVSI